MGQDGVSGRATERARRRGLLSWAWTRPTAESGSKILPHSLLCVQIYAQQFSYKTSRLQGQAGRRSMLTWKCLGGGGHCLSFYHDHVIDNRPAVRGASNREAHFFIMRGGRVCMSSGNRNDSFSCSRCG